MVRLGQTSLMGGIRDFGEDAGKSVDAADNRGLQQQMAARDGGRVQESGGARNGRVDDSTGPLVRGTSVKPESLSEDDGSGGEGHYGGDSTDDVFVYAGVGIGYGLDDLDGTPQNEGNR